MATQKIIFLIACFFTSILFIPINSTAIHSTPLGSTSQTNREWSATPGSYYNYTISTELSFSMDTSLQNALNNSMYNDFESYLANVSGKDMRYLLNGADFNGTYIISKVFRTEPFIIHMQYLVKNIYQSQMLYHNPFSEIDTAVDYDIINATSILNSTYLTEHTMKAINNSLSTDYSAELTNLMYEWVIDKYIRPFFANNTLFFYGFTLGAGINSSGLNSSSLNSSNIESGLVGDEHSITTWATDINLTDDTTDVLLPFGRTSYDFSSTSIPFFIPSTISLKYEYDNIKERVIKQNLISSSVEHLIKLYGVTDLRFWDKRVFVRYNTSAADSFFQALYFNPRFSSFLNGLDEWGISASENVDPKNVSLNGIADLTWDDEGALKNAHTEIQAHLLTNSRGSLEINAAFDISSGIYLEKDKLYVPLMNGGGSGLQIPGYPVFYILMLIGIISYVKVTGSKFQKQLRFF